MLRTLITIGNQLGKEMDEWDDLINQIEVDKTTGKDSTPLNNLIAEIVFDLDSKDVYVSTELRAYDDRSPKIWRCIKITDRNGKSVLSCVYVKKNLEQFRKTFFGKEGKVEKGEFAQAIESKQPALMTSKLYEALEEVYSLKPVFDEKFIDDKKGIVSYEKLWSGLNLGKLDRIILLYASVMSEKLGLLKPTPVKDLEGFEKYFIPAKIAEEKKETKDPRLCYATSEILDDVQEPNFIDRQGLNYMFVTTTINYASNFEKKSFAKNYQASNNIQTALERGSGYVLNNLRTKIAGIDHCIIPEFLSFEPEPSLDKVTKIHRRCDLLFRSEHWEKLIEDIEDEVAGIYWVTFLGYKFDGNSFKAVNQIKSVSKHHLNKLILAFHKLHNEWKSQDDFPWREVMSNKEKTFDFTLRSVYNIIPVKKDLLKNQALIFFKSILENRKVDKHQIFEFFTELILCYRHKRFKAYANIYQNDNFDFAARDAVFKHLALIQILKQFKLINGMESTNLNPPPEAPTPEKAEDFQERIERFFTRMEYDDDKKAMFYLGRILSSIASAQAQKEHKSKPILNKLNFNGINLKDIERLRLDLTEKTQQYRLHDKTEYAFAQFHHFFKHKDWSMPPQEALFFLLSGYSFLTGSKKSKSNTSTSNQ